MPEIGPSGSEGGAKIAFVPTPIIAQAFRPGEATPAESALKGRQTWAFPCQIAQYFTNCWGRNTFGRPYSLQGDFHLLADPGLKAWAMVSDRFAVKSDRHLGYHLSRLRRCY
jgi:hypothetical protein